MNFYDFLATFGFILLAFMAITMFIMLLEVMIISNNLKEIAENKKNKASDDS